MPSGLILDFDSVDLSQSGVDRRGIAEMLPHRGPIAMLDRVIWHEFGPGRAVAVHHVPTDAWWIDGHIPGHPLMPGVLQIEAAAQLASFLYYKQSKKTWFAGFTRIDDVTFRGQVAPGDDLYLLCVEEKYSIRRFISRVQGVVNGQIAFDGQISGMAFPKMGEEIQRRPLTAEELDRHKLGTIG